MAVTRAAKDQIDEDIARRHFIDRLDRLAIARGLSLTDWEIQFVADLINSPRPFTDDQRKAIDQLRSRFKL